MKSITTDIPARIDRLPWSRFHLLVVISLGVTWILDGLEVTIVGSLGPILKDYRTLGLTDENIGSAASIYVAGAVLGALLFGWLTDRFGRRLVFNITLSIYLLGVLASAFAWDFWSFGVFRFITGIAIGGEYAAINSAIDEWMPARLRGRIDLIVNGSYWAGAALGAFATLILLSGKIVSIDLGWRLGFGIGAILGSLILYMRRFIPESPRWQVTHGYLKEAEATVEQIESKMPGKLAQPKGKLTLRPQRSYGFRLVFGAMLGEHRGRSFLALVLMASQAFLFNSVFFTYGLVLAHYYHVDAAHTGLYILPLAVSNFLGPLILGRFFDTIGRKTMIAATYGITGALLFLVAWLFGENLLSTWMQTVSWMVIFFFASAAASSAYLTASEIFPLETRAMAIAVFYALGTLIGGVSAPLIFGYLIATNDPWMVGGGYAFAAILMVFAAICELRLGVEAAGESLENIAPPLSSVV